MSEQKDVTVWASVGCTIQVRQFEPVKIEMGVAGIPVGASSEYLSQQLDAANLTLHEIIDSLTREMQQRLHDDFGR